MCVHTNKTKLISHVLYDYWPQFKVLIFHPIVYLCCVLLTLPWQHTCDKRQDGVVSWSHRMGTMKNIQAACSYSCRSKVITRVYICIQQICVWYDVSGRGGSREINRRYWAEIQTIPVKFYHCNQKRYQLMCTG